ncbi:hypothetical protein N8987_07215 [Crocinitomix sp.]|nr:hypothetical protein [Crocinitomix sp.]
MFIQLRNIILFVVSVISVNAFDQGYEWEELPNFPGLSRDDAIAFSIGELIYVGSGNHGGFSQSNQFYALDTDLNSWSQIAEFPGVRRQYARGETVNGKGYLIGGIDPFNNPLNDIWEYDPQSNTWKELTVFPGGERWQAASFVIEDKIYFGTGRDLDKRFADFWRFNIATNEWEELNDLPKLPCYETVSFSIFDKGYLGLGRDCTGVFLSDFWMYDPMNDSWKQETDFPGGARYYSKGESYNGFGFVGTGEDEFGMMKDDIWEFDPFTQAWTEILGFPGVKQRGVASTAIPNKGVYYICGLSDSFTRLNTVYHLFNESQINPYFKYDLDQTHNILRIRNINVGAPIQVFSLNGELVFESIDHADNLLIHTNSWSRGMYVLHHNNQSEKIMLY